MIAFRALCSADLERVLDNERRAYAYPWTHGNFVDCLREGKDCRVAVRQGEIIGHGILAVAVGEAHVLNVCVAPDWQGQGHGRALLADLLERARARGAELVFLEVRSSNRPAIALYESMGFNEIAVRRNYYPAATGHEDAQVMALDLRSEFQSGAL